MANIEKNDGVRANPADSVALDLWLAPHHGVLPRLAAAMARLQAHPARTVVLLPFAQLLPLAQRLWSHYAPQGFAPRFETTQNWCTGLGSHTGDTLDLSFDQAVDLMTAGELLQRAGLRVQRDALAALLVESAYALAPMAAAVPPAQRGAWAQRMRPVCVGATELPGLAWEAAVMRLALEWVAASGYASDQAFAPHVQAAVDGLVVVHGHSPDPIAHGLLAHWGERGVGMDLMPASPDSDVVTTGRVQWHPCLDAEDEALRATACVLQRVHQGLFPVALVSADRALTRRMRAMLESAGLSMRDENGWKLSTTRAASGVMALLRACVWNASTDAVLNWLKLAPEFANSVNGLEAALRRDAVSEWSAAAHSAQVQAVPELEALYGAVQALRSIAGERRSVVQWLGVLRQLLQADGQWSVLEEDAAGRALLQALRLNESEPGASLRTWSWHTQIMDVSAFTRWVNQCLEAAAFKPDYPAQEQVVILPMHQLLGRPFAAVVLAGCDEVRLHLDTPLPGGWTTAQRTAMGLPTRDDMAQRMRMAWAYALQTPQVDVLWRTSDEAGEHLAPSVLVQAQQAAAALALLPSAADPRTLRTVAQAPTRPTQPSCQALPVRTLTASAYQSLRTCPYQFFALRQLGLYRAEELESEVDKRDFGIWLHAVLHRFHGARSDAGRVVAEDLALLDQCAHEVTQTMHLQGGVFLPFEAAWPAVRQGYVQWLQQHEAQGAVYLRGESPERQALGSCTLVGRLDRIDQWPDGQWMVVDYKTENDAVTRERIKHPQEDTQIAFYAALLPHDTVRAGYLSITEKGTKWLEQSDVVAARDALVQGIQEDVQRIAQGAPLPALGAGDACDYCDARGLCRKDFWSLP